MGSFNGLVKGTYGLSKWAGTSGSVQLSEKDKKILKSHFAKLVLMFSYQKNYKIINISFLIGIHFPSKCILPKLLVSTSW